MKYYIAQDLSGTYFVYTKKPHKGMVAWISSGGYSYPVSPDFIEDINLAVKVPVPKWSDKEPVEILIKIKQQ